MEQIKGSETNSSPAYSDFGIQGDLSDMIFMIISKHAGYEAGSEKNPRVLKSLQIFRFWLLKDTLRSVIAIES